MRGFTTKCVLTLTLSLPGFAQTTSAVPAWSVVTTTQIKPEFRQEYEAAQKELSAAYKKAGAPSRIVIQTMLGDVAEYISIVPITKLADLDGPTPLVKAIGEAGSQRLLKRAGGYLVAVHRSTDLAMPEISINTPMENPGEYAQVMIMRLFPGKAADFVTFMKDDYVPAAKKADVANLWVSRPIFGGDLNDRVVVRPLHKMAELDGGPLMRKALGEEGARRLGEKQSTIVQSTTYRIVRVRPDLSLMPPAPPKALAKAGE
jgi:hypothetical protein